MNKILCLCFLVLSMSCSAQKDLPKKGWISLFNGKDLKDWNIKIKGHDLNENFANTFRVEDGIMKVDYSGYKDWNEQYGHIFHKNKYSAYLLVVEYRFTGEQIAGGPGWAWRNSGAMLHSQAPESMLKDQDFPISLEAQFLGGNGKEERSTLNLCTPGTNVFLDGKLFTTHCVNSSSKTYDGDQWVRVEMLVLGDSIKHIIDGKTVLEYTNTQIGGGNVEPFDPKVKVDGKPLKEGYIAFQSESHPVEFRRIDLFNLEKYMSDQDKLRGVVADLLAPGAGR
ncbi:DUF1080 domain-containing protein [Flavihumibacter sp. R14]|nr:DUF1080 domain-containing protein [Flavihumibacter soli]